MEKRFLIQIEFYEYGETARDAKLRAENKCKDLNEAFDCDAKIFAMFDAPFARRATIIDFENLKADLDVANQVKHVELTAQEEKRMDDIAEQRREEDLHNGNKNE